MTRLSIAQNERVIDMWHTGTCVDDVSIAMGFIPLSVFDLQRRVKKAITADHLRHIALRHFHNERIVTMSRAHANDLKPAEKCLPPCKVIKSWTHLYVIAPMSASPLETMTLTIGWDCNEVCNGECYVQFYIHEISIFGGGSIMAWDDCCRYVRSRRIRILYCVRVTILARHYLRNTGITDSASWCGLRDRQTWTPTSMCAFSEKISLKKTSIWTSNLFQFFSLIL